jgi:hypothetical protein
MSKKSKLHEAGLVEEAKELRKEGFGYIAIADTIKKQHPEITELSHMAVKRALEIVERDKIEGQIEEGKNPVDEFAVEFKNKTDENTKKLEGLEKKANDILDKAMGGDDISDMTKAMKELREVLGQITKNRIAIQQYGVRQINNLDREAFKQKEQVRILLVKWINIIKEDTCPMCKEKVIPKVIELVGLEE